MRAQSDGPDVQYLQLAIPTSDPGFGTRNHKEILAWQLWRAKYPLNVTALFHERHDARNVVEIFVVANHFSPAGMFFVEPVKNNGGKAGIGFA